jgi:hypothetical protein
VLVWVCLRYEDGKLRNDRPLKAWLKEDVNGCRKKKRDFLGGGVSEGIALASHRTNWEVALSCLTHISSMYQPRRTAALEDGYIFSTWLKAEVETTPVIIIIPPPPLVREACR